MTKGDLCSNNRMDEEQAVGYMLLTCREMGLSMEQIKQIKSIMITQFQQHSPDEAKKQGAEWFRSIREKPINQSKYNSLEDRIPNSIYKRVNVKIPKIPESHHTRKLREKNERIIEELQQMQNGPFGLFKLFRRCKCNPYYESRKE
ncbi:hypothetical protein [Virgibacillus proomii]|uniref:hypothetical protein n=1 Tax=Virgibacillus proomii TaxID=84407 RepID=UPI0009879905|nr:hypothetical protein [Virgibacillus proomii]